MLYRTYNILFFVSTPEAGQAVFENYKSYYLSASLLGVLVYVTLVRLRV